MKITLTIYKRKVKKGTKVTLNTEGDLDEFINLSAQGRSSGWTFARDELYEKSYIFEDKQDNYLFS